MRRTAFVDGEWTDRILTSVDRALDVLEAFSLEQPEMALGEIALKLEMGKSTVHKLLHTLGTRGYIAQDQDTRRYRLGLGNWSLGTVAVGSLDVRRIAAPHVRELAALSGEQVMLWVLEGGDALCVDRVDSRHRVRSYTHLGATEKPEDLSAGRCLLAFAGEGAIAAAMRRIEDARGAPAARLLTTRLAAVRAENFDVNTGDLWPHIRAISTPIRDGRSSVIAAITVSGPDSRFDDAARQAALPDLLRTGAAVSAELGFSSEPGPAAVDHPADHVTGRRR